MSSTLSRSMITGVSLPNISIFTTAVHFSASMFLTVPFIPLKSPVLSKTRSPSLNGILSCDLSCEFWICCIILAYSSSVNGMGRVSAPTINLTPGVFLMTYRILSFICDLTKTYPGYNFLCLMIFSHFLSEDSLTIGDI